MSKDETVDIHHVLHEENEHLSGRMAVPDKTEKIGLALSGGGIRSATFSLGVLQALAAAERLASFDYLSTVSGGGYIGSWLSAWIHRSGLKEVQDELKRHGADPGARLPSADEPEQVTWLRRYSNYLSPRVGIFSLDSLTLICTWLRNVALNLIVILGSMALLFVLPHLAIGAFEGLRADALAFGYAAGWCALVALALVGYNLWHQGMPITRRRNWVITTPGVLVMAVVPSVLAATLASVWLFRPGNNVDSARVGVVYVVGLLFALLLAWFVVEGATKVKWETGPKVQTVVAELLRKFGVYAMSGGVAVLVGSLLLTGMLQLWSKTVGEWKPEQQFIVQVAYGPPVLLVALGVATSVFTGLVGRVFYERSREWWSRLNAWLMLVAVVWALWCSLAFFSLPLLKWVHGHLGGWVSALGTAWIGTLLTSIFLRKPDAASEKTQLRVDLMLNTAAMVFIIGLLVTVAALTSLVLLRGSPDAESSEAGNRNVIFELNSGGERIDYKRSAPKAPGALEFGDAVKLHIEALPSAMGKPSFLWGLPEPVAAALTLFVVILVFGLRVDVNKFSLHNLYKNRLVRCYLGASNKRRNEQPFTGLDDEDDIPLRDLCEGGRVQRPLHIINTALNISQGANLAWQERKAASFVLTPLYCGFSLARTQGDTTRTERVNSWKAAGYRPTAEYASKDPEERGFSLGMALATSGAAVSPNMGYATRPARAFVLTLFNVRLGRWSPNPMGTKWRSPSPRAGLIPLVQELFGYSNERRDFVYLSDGGHFDNLGLYELVRRRCSTIVAVDAGADPKRMFRDLAESIRKCRIDMGVEIELPIDELESPAGDPLARPEKSYSKGLIKYGDGGADGQLILIKPTMCADRAEPVDLLNFAEQNPPFPQQSTADQFFGESQFESYRRLGLHIGARCLKDYEDLLPPHAIRERTPSVSPAPEAPTMPTRWLYDILKWWRNLPVGERSRDESLVDALLFTLLASLVMALGLWLFRSMFIPSVPVGCLDLDACKASIAAMLRAAPADNWGAAPRYVFLALDNVFVALYTASFLMLFVVATREPGKATRGPLRSVLLLCLCLLAIATCVVDYYENFSLVARLVEGKTKPDLLLVRISLTKFVLSALCLVAALPSLVLAARVFKLRWARKTYVARTRYFRGRS